MLLSGHTNLSLRALRAPLAYTLHTTRHRNDTLVCYGLVPVRGVRCELCWRYRLKACGRACVDELGFTVGLVVQYITVDHFVSNYAFGPTAG